MSHSQDVWKYHCPPNPIGMVRSLPLDPWSILDTSLLPLAPTVLVRVICGVTFVLDWHILSSPFCRVHICCWRAEQYHCPLPQNCFQCYFVLWGALQTCLHCHCLFHCTFGKCHWVFPFPHNVHMFVLDSLKGMETTLGVSLAPLLVGMLPLVAREPIQVIIYIAFGIQAWGGVGGGSYLGPTSPK